MRRWVKWSLAALAAFLVLLGLNAVVLDSQTKDAEVSVEGGEIVRLPGGDLQVLAREPVFDDPVLGADRPRRPAGAPIVLLNCFTCSINWWDELMPRLAAGGHRVIAIDLLGHGGSEKPGSGYSIPDQAQLVSQALGRLGVEGAIVAGHSLGGAVAVSLAEQAPKLVSGVVILDTAPDSSYGELGLLAQASLTPVIGEGLWRVKTSWSVRNGLAEAFAPGYDVPDQFVEDVKRMTYTSFDDSHSAFDSFVGEEALDARLERLDLPLLAIFGAEDQIAEPRESLSAYAGAGADTALVQGAGHSPNVEKPEETARLVLRFADRAQPPVARPRPRRERSRRG